jgi:hypothetical protein
MLCQLISKECLELKRKFLCFCAVDPICVYTKNLFFIALTASVFISCTRAIDNENSKVSILNDGVEDSESS